MTPEWVKHDCEKTETAGCPSDWYMSKIWLITVLVRAANDIAQTFPASVPGTDVPVLLLTKYLSYWLPWTRNELSMCCSLCSATKHFHWSLELKACAHRGPKRALTFIMAYTPLLAVICALSRARPHSVHASISSQTGESSIPITSTLGAAALSISGT